MKTWNLLPTTDNISAYYKAIGEIPMLTLEEEMTAGSQLPAEEARITLVMSHLRLAISIARNYQKYGQQLQDLVQEANLALFIASGRFKPEQGRFSSYASIYINSALTEFSLKNDRVMTLATSKPQKKMYYNMGRIKNKYMGAQVRNFTAAEVAEIAVDYNVSEDDVREMESRLRTSSVSLDAKGEGDEPSLQDTIADMTHEPLEVLTRAEMSFIESTGIQEALSQLDERQQFIITARWIDLDDNDNGLTLGDLASIYNVSVERIRQIEKQALKKLRTLMEEYA